MNKFIFFALIAAVSCNDLIQGPNEGRKIYDENKEASPAIWKQSNEVTIKANDTDVISRVVITDMRPDKDGEAKIIDGGQGQKNVTVQLKSPTILRGYYFHIEVYAVEDNESHVDSGTTESYTEVSTDSYSEGTTDQSVEKGTKSDEEITTEHVKSTAEVSFQTPAFKTLKTNLNENVKRL